MTTVNNSLGLTLNRAKTIQDIVDTYFGGGSGVHLNVGDYVALRCPCFVVGDKVFVIMSKVTYRPNYVRTLRLAIDQEIEATKERLVDSGAHVVKPNGRHGVGDIGNALALCVPIEHFDEVAENSPYGRNLLAILRHTTDQLRLLMAQKFDRESGLTQQTSGEVVGFGQFNKRYLTSVARSVQPMAIVLQDRLGQPGISDSLKLMLTAKTETSRIAITNDPRYVSAFALAWMQSGLRRGVAGSDASIVASADNFANSCFAYWIPFPDSAFGKLSKADRPDWSLPTRDILQRWIAAPQRALFSSRHPVTKFFMPPGFSAGRAIEFQRTAVTAIVAYVSFSPRSWEKAST